ncbi:Rha family transcriptional regulator [Terasakiella sp. SH-1]|uniref:Rha family transcriptional regulator n=1 Tax=Terasakiella sp. SH-1 TaxID=2560057 RepID=UPI001073A97C|nr:Rha family transcriptional regulator [Terasakiella sp. SH-1]
MLPVVKQFKGKVFADSRDVADYFGKRHDNVIQKIKGIGCSKKFRHLNFKEAEYIDDQGKGRKSYQMTKDGFTFLVMGFTGKKAAEFKECYIQRFNEMEDALNGQGLFWQEERDKGLVYRRHFTQILQDHGVNGFGFKNCTDAINKEVAGCTAKKLIEKRGLPAKANARDALNSEELHCTWMIERLASERIEVEGRQGNRDCFAATQLTSHEFMDAINQMKSGWLPKQVLVSGEDK